MNQQVMLDGTRPMVSLQEALAQQFHRHQDTSPAAIAARLGVSELQLLMAACGPHVTRLACTSRALLSDLACLGPVQAITPSRQAEHEHRQLLEYRRLRLAGNRGLLQSGEYKLELNFDNWRYGFAVSRPVRGGIEQSLHFFDRRGHATHRIRLTAASDSLAYRMFVGAYHSSDQGPELRLPCEPPTAHNRAGTADEPVPGSGRAGGCQRTISSSLVTELLRSLADLDLCVSFKLGNPGALHTWRGMVDSVRSEDGRLILQAAGYSLSLVEAQIAGARLPCRSNAVELYVAGGETLATLAGPPRNQPQADIWLRLLGALPEQTGCQSRP